EARSVEGRAEQRVQLHAVAAAAVGDELAPDRSRREVGHDAEQRFEILEGDRTHLRLHQRVEAVDARVDPVEADAAEIVGQRKSHSLNSGWNAAFWFD